MSADSEGDSRQRLVVLFGGQSAEHDISRVTARSVLAAVDPLRYSVEAIGIDEAGAWHLGPEIPRSVLDDPAALSDGLPIDGPVVDPLPLLVGSDQTRPVVLPLLHGPLGEDGTIQGLLEVADVAYVGTAVLGSALAMDKSMAKIVTAEAGIPQVRHRSLHHEECTSEVLSSVYAELGPVVFVKPANMGSSIGVSRANSVHTLESSVALAQRFDEWILIEEGVEAREIEVAVLGNRSPKASLPGEIIAAGEFYDYQDKYVDGLAQLVIPAVLTESQTEEVQALALAAYTALRTAGMARVDFLFEEDGRGFLLNEINTIPGFTPSSMYPKLWEASGVTYPKLIDELIGFALERHRHRASFRAATRHAHQRSGTSEHP